MISEIIGLSMRVAQRFLVLCSSLSIEGRGNELFCVLLFCQYISVAYMVFAIRRIRNAATCYAVIWPNTFYFYPTWN